MTLHNQPRWAVAQALNHRAYQQPDGLSRPQGCSTPYACVCPSAYRPHRPSCAAFRSCCCAVRLRRLPPSPPMTLMTAPCGPSGAETSGTAAPAAGRNPSQTAADTQDTGTWGCLVSWKGRQVDRFCRHIGLRPLVSASALALCLVLYISYLLPHPRHRLLIAGFCDHDVWALSKEDKGVSCLPANTQTLD